MEAVKGGVMAIKFFPSRLAGQCAVCGKAYQALEMVAFYPGSQISHAYCAMHPEELVNAAAPPLRVIKGEKLDAFKARLNAKLPENCEPMPFQYEGVYQIQRFGNRALLADEQGLGKTIQALMWLAANNAMRPAVLIVPSSVKLNWRKEIKRWLPRKRSNKVYILNGRKPVTLPTTGIFVINYDIVKFWLADLLKIKPQVVICDESQYLKNPQAQRTKAVLGSRRGTSEYLCKYVQNRLFLSGTPAENRPVELWPILANIRPDLYGNYMQYVNRYCAAYPNRWGLNVSGASNVAELATSLRKNCMIRRLKADVLPELPAKRRVTIPVEITNRKEYEFAERDLIAWMRQNDQDITGALRAEALVRIGKLKQIAVRGKLDAAMEWVHNFLTGDTKKLVVFAYHREIVAQVLEELKQYNPVYIRGQDSDSSRQTAVDRFQNDPSVRVIVCSLRAARLGITLTAASDTVTLEFGWTPGEHDQAEDRVHRIGQKNAVIAYYLLADKTIDAKIAKVIDSKRAVIAGLIDQREISKSEDILGSLVTEMAA